MVVVVPVGMWMVLVLELSVGMWMVVVVPVGRWMMLVLVGVSGYVDGAGGCQWVCGWWWCWWMSVGMWMVLVVSVGVWMVLGKPLSVCYTEGVSGYVDGVGGCQWVCGWC